MGISESVTEVMERASAALLATSYFEVETLCVKAMELARRSRDFETMARIILPLQEARRQRRHMATDTGIVKVLVALPSEGTVLESACYLLKPPLIAAEATSVRELAFAQQIPAAILTREPRTSTGKWPVVAVTTDRSFRAQIDAPRVNGTEVADGDAPDIGHRLRRDDRRGHDIAHPLPKCLHDLASVNIEDSHKVVLAHHANELGGIIKHRRLVNTVRLQRSPGCAYSVVDTETNHLALHDLTSVIQGAALDLAWQHGAVCAHCFFTRSAACGGQIVNLPVDVFAVNGA